MPWSSSATVKAMSAAGGVVATHVAGGADDAAPLEREQADVVLAVDVRQRGQHAARELGRHAREEPLVARVGGESREELSQTRPVFGRLGLSVTALPSRSTMGELGSMPPGCGTAAPLSVGGNPTADPEPAGLELVEEVQAEAVERLLGLEVERGELAGEQQQAHRDQHGAGERGDDQVAVAQPAERRSSRA